MKKHNGIISLWKFIFSLMILMFHSFYIEDGLTGVVHNRFSCGAIAVDFFFIVSGFLLAAKVFSVKDDEVIVPVSTATKAFIFRKIKAIFPYLLFSFVILFVLSVVTNSRALQGYVDSFIDLTFLKLSGIPAKGVVGGSWYISAMILAMLLIYPLQYRYRKNFSYIVAPLIAIFLGGYLMHYTENLRDYDTWAGFIMVGMGKAIFEICIGCVMYEVKEKLSKLNFTKIGSIVLSVVEFICFAIVIYCNLCGKNVRSLDWLFIILLMIGIVIAFSGKTFFFERADNKFFFYLERLSLPIYLNNFVFIKINNSFFLNYDLDWKYRFIIYFVLTIILSIVELYLMKYIIAFCGKIKTKIGKLLIAE